MMTVRLAYTMTMVAVRMTASEVAADCVDRTVAIGE
jgi:hypothetical protein